MPPPNVPWGFPIGAMGPPGTTGAFSGTPYGPAGYPWDLGLENNTPEDWLEYQFIEDFEDDPGGWEQTDPATGLSTLGAGPGFGSMVPGWANSMNYPGNPIDYTDPGVTGFGPQAPAGNQPFGPGILGGMNFGPAVGQAAQGLMQNMGQALPPALVPNFPFAPGWQQQEFNQGNPFPQLDEYYNTPPGAFIPGGPVGPAPMPAPFMPQPFGAPLF